MKQLSLLVHNPTGLHARPAKVLTSAAKKFKSDIVIWNGEKKANAKSMISLMTLGVKPDTMIRLEISGEDEAVAAAVLEDLVNNGLGYDEPAAQPVQSPTPSTAPLPQAESIFENAGTSGHLIKGIPAAPGIGIGPLYRLQREKLAVEETFTSVEHERARLHDALQQARQQIVTLRDQLGAKAANEAAILDAHLEILEDPDLLEAVGLQINAQNGAADAWQTSIEDRVRLMVGLEDPLLAARSADLHDVGQRVLRLLAGVAEPEVLPWPDYPVIVVADDLSPSDTAVLAKNGVLGFCTAGGGPTAHSVIIARALGIAAVVAAGDAVLSLASGTTVILDGSAGTVVFDPDEDTLSRACDAQNRYRARRAIEQEQSRAPAITLDGHRVEIAANIGGVGDACQALGFGADGVGVLRTEFLFLNRATPPNEQEQFEVYRDAVMALEGKPVIIRTLDVGGDKPLPYIPRPREANPFLGVRGIRMCLERPELLHQQLRAILRASKFGRLRIMLPMVTELSEWRAARSIVDEVQIELRLPAVEVGIMIEVPAAALMADVFAAEVDFFSIGTNDLAQYTLAMDRTHPTLATRSDGLHPAVLRLIGRTVEAAHQAGKWAGVCGELAADPQAVPILVGLGVDELSVSVPAIPAVKAQVRTLTFAGAQRLAEEALQCATAVEVRTRLEKAAVIDLGKPQS